jgi:hypothetical protein
VNDECAHGKDADQRADADAIDSAEAIATGHRADQRHRQRGDAHRKHGGWHHGLHRVRAIGTRSGIS